MSSDAPAPDRTLERWVGRLSAAPLPVLASTLARLAELREREDCVRPRDISQLVLHDPFMALRVLRFLGERRSARAMADITTVEHAVMMLGVSPFFRAFSGLQAVEGMLRANEAIAGLMEVVGRARHAALHARDIAQLRHDLESDEVVIAALLHDMAEMLLWCFGPAQAAEIAGRLDRSPAPHGAQVQREVLGFSLNELQVTLAGAWGLPPLITSLMDDHNAQRPRVRNVLLAVSLARHAARGWEAPGLPEHIEGIGRLIGRPVPEVRQRVFRTALEAVRDHDWYGESAPPVWLPPFPMQAEAAEVASGPRISEPVLARVKRLLATADGEELVNWTAAGSAVANGPPGPSAVLALAMHGLFKGAGLARHMYCVLQADGLLARPRYLGGVREAERLGRTGLPLGMANAFTRRLVEQGVLWWQAAHDPIALPELPREWRMAAGNDGFFAAMLRMPDGRGGLLYADGGAAEGALDEQKFAHFREICLLLDVRFAGPGAAAPA